MGATCTSLAGVVAPRNEPLEDLGTRVFALFAVADAKKAVGDHALAHAGSGNDALWHLSVSTLDSVATEPVLEDDESCLICLEKFVPESDEFSAGECAESFSPVTGMWLECMQP